MARVVDACLFEVEASFAGACALSKTYGTHRSRMNHP